MLNFTSDTQPLLSVVDAKTILTGQNPFGSVSDGLLRIKGYPFRPLLRHELFETRIVEGQRLSLEMHWDEHARVRKRGHWLSRVYLPLLQCRNSTLGLILRRTGGTAGEYKRMGLFRIVHERAQDPWPGFGFDVFHEFFRDLALLSPGGWERRTGATRLGLEECILVIK